jgi:TP901 family phage tail tape measure protein
MADRSLTLGTLFTANATQFISTITMMKKKVGELNATFVSVGTKGAKGVDKATKSVAAMGGAMDKSSGQAAKHKKSLRGVAGALDRIKTAAKITASFAAAAAAITAVTRALGAGLQEMIDYDQGLKNLQAITNATDQEVFGMGETIKNVARTTKFSTAEVAEGMVLLGQAGFSATESMQAMNSVADLATGTLSSMQFTADLMTTTIRAFGMSTVESAKAADIMANAINRSKLTIDKLRIAFNFVGAASHQAGLTLEETAASMMVLANQGLRASTIGTGLRQVLSRLLSPTGRLREEFEANNIELKKVNPSLVGFRTALENLLPVIYDHAKGTVNMAKAYRLFGLRGAMAAAVLTSAIASGNYDRMLELTYETGTAARMAAKQIEGLGLKIKNLADRARLIAVALGEAGLIGALGAIVDGLKAVATGIESFFRSGMGKVVAAFIGWTIVIYGSVKALHLLVNVIGFAGKGLQWLSKTLFTAASAQAAFNASAGKGSGALRIIGGAARGLPAPLLAIAAAIAVIVVAIKLWTGATERRIKALQKEQAETTTQVQTLGLYVDILDDLEKKQSEGADITKEHARAIRRMRGDSEKLIPVLREEGKFLALNREQLERTYSSKLTQAIQQQIELVKQYRNAAEEATFWSGAWNLVVTKVKEKFAELKAELIWFVTFLPKGIAKLVEEFWNWLDSMGLISGGVKRLTDKVKSWWEDTKKAYKDWVLSYAKESKKVKAANEQVSKGLVELARLMRLEDAGKSFEDIIKQIELLEGKKLGAATFDAIKVAITGITLKLKEEQKEWKFQIDKLPIYFQEMYKDMDGLRKADFAKVIKSMQAELAAFEKSADLMDLKEEERASARSAIRARHLAKFAADAEKEKEITEESVNEQLRMFAILEQGTKEMFHRRTTSLLNYYLTQVELAEGNKEKLAEVEKKFREALTEEHKKLNEELLSIDKRRQELTLQLQKQTVEEIKKLHKKMMDDLKDQLQDQYDDLRSERDDFIKELANIDKSYEDTIRGIRQKTMTDEQKWLDDRKRANELMNRARRTSDADLYKEAQSLAADLAREVKDDNGDVVRTIESTSRVATGIVNKVHRLHTRLIEDEVRDRKYQMETLEEAIKKLDQQIKDFGATIDTVNKKEMVIKAEKTIAQLEKVYEVNNKFKTEWDELKDKTITLTVKYNYIGKQSGGGGGEESTGEGGGSSSAGTNLTSSEKGEHKTTSGKRWGGFIEKLMALGGKLAGYGGGDKVHARLEPGEYVVRKEAVKKYGGAVFEGLNNMTIPDVLGSVGKRLGGIIGDSFRRFQTGGSVPAHAAMQANQQTFNITVSPKYLTGDRQAMRTVAKDISTAIQEQSRRWGVK